MPSKGKVSGSRLDEKKAPCLASTSPPFDGACPITDDGTCVDYEEMEDIYAGVQGRTSTKNAGQGCG